MRDGDRTPWTDDAIRRIREAQAEGKPTVTLFECVADAIANEVEQLREEATILRRKVADLLRDQVLQMRKENPIEEASNG